MSLPHAFGERDSRPPIGAGQLAPDQIHAGVRVRAATPERFLEAVADRPVRAMRTKAGSRRFRSCTAARNVRVASAREIRSLPAIWPHRVGKR